MRFEFDQGVPEGCTAWLRAHVGIGNIEEQGSRTQHWTHDQSEYGWFYERIRKASSLQGFDDDPWRYVPTITVKDPKLATLFALRWLS